MVRPVDVEMAVGALASANETRVDSGETAGLRRMRRRIVALLAEPRLRDLEQLLVGGAVRVVAVRAALDHRRMLPHERPALFGVAGVADLVDGAGDEELVVRRPM